MNVTTVTVCHNFETAHRLPHIPGKCESLHGHSWWVEVTVSAPAPNKAGMVVEFGAFKKALRAWIDRNLDHGVMLGPDDPLVPVLRKHKTKVHEVPGWPTVENVAAMLTAQAAIILADTDHAAETFVSAVEVRETHVNRAGWRSR